jgi:hypothetical protein
MAELLIPEGMEDNPTHVALVLTFEEAAHILALTGACVAGEGYTDKIYGQLADNYKIEKRANEIMLINEDDYEIELIKFKEYKR